MTAPAFNTVAWFQVGTDDPAGAKRFYGELFGWTFTQDPGAGGAYDLVHYGDSPQPNGGIADISGGGATGKHAIFLVVVEDVPAALAKAEQLGGKVLVPATTSPDGLVFAHVLDPSGNEFGLFTPPQAG